WLSALFIGEMLTATAMGRFEGEIARAVVLALFVPLIISSGGNSGSQASTLVVRALALGQLRLRDWWRVVRRELSAGLALGTVLAAIGFGRILLWQGLFSTYGEHYLLVALTVATSLVGVVTWGTLGTFGIPGDRGWAVRDEAAGEIRGAKKLPALLLLGARYLEEPVADRIPPAEITFPDGGRVRTDAPEAAARLTELLGRRVTLWPLRPPDDRPHYRRGLPDHPDFETELRAIFGRLPDEPLPDLAVFPPELFEYT